MHILVLDGGHVEAEFREKFGPNHAYTFISLEYTEKDEWLAIEQAVNEGVAKANIAFCFGKADHGRHSYHLLETVAFPVFTEVLRVSSIESRWEAVNKSPTVVLFGFCGLPTLLNRSLLEVSLYNEADREKLTETCAALGTDYRVVEDRVGLVTPRIICMIINEACYTVQEGTATMHDVDLSMRLGTSYPRGPFAWANAIGVERVYAVLEAMWNDTHDERYKICPLLKRQALRGEPFVV